MLQKHPNSFWRHTLHPVVHLSVFPKTQRTKQGKLPDPPITHFDHTHTHTTLWHSSLGDLSFKLCNFWFDSLLHTHARCSSFHNTDIQSQSRLLGPPNLILHTATASTVFSKHESALLSMRGHLSAWGATRRGKSLLSFVGKKMTKRESLMSRLSFPVTFVNVGGKKGGICTLVSLHQPEWVVRVNQLC